MGQDIAFINQRLDSHSKRINKLRKKLDNILSSHKHYLQKRLPDVLRREKARLSFTSALEKAGKILSAFGKERFSVVSKSKDKEKREQRFVGLFTHTELLRLRRLLDTDHSFSYKFYRQKSYNRLKDEHILFLTDDEKRRLRYLLRKSKSQKEANLI